MPILSIDLLDSRLMPKNREIRLKWSLDKYITRSEKTIRIKFQGKK